MKKELVLDINIPYCIKPLKNIGGIQIIGSNEEKNAYMNALMRETLSFENQLDDYVIKAVRLSGGSVTVMKPDLLGQLLSTIRKHLPLENGAEVSFDSLPCTIGTPGLSGIALGRPNRTRLMMFSYLEDELKELECPFTLQDVKNAFLYFNRFHLNNIDVYLNYGIKNQTKSSFKHTLESCMILGVKHFTLERIEGNCSQRELDEMYEMAKKMLEASGYGNYLNGFFCMKGFENVFISKLAEGCEAIGMGLNALSVFDGYISRNSDNRNIYIQNAGNAQKTIAEACVYYNSGEDSILNIYR